MTDTVRHLTVILENDVRVDNVQSLVRAIHHMRGVANVVLGQPTDLASITADLRARTAIRDRIVAILFDKENT